MYYQDQDIQAYQFYCPQTYIYSSANINIEDTESADPFSDQSSLKPCQLENTTEGANRESLSY
jgi:hypothetical protein